MSTSQDSGRPHLSTRLAFWAIRHGVRLPGYAIERYSQLTALRDVLDRLEVDCVIDVGANRGQFGGHLRGIGYRGWIVSFEPSRSDFEVLQTRRDDRWTAFAIALGSQSGSRLFNLTARSVNNSFLVPVGERIDATVAVPTSRLDEMLDQIIATTGARRIFLKVDTQGFDLEVVRGAGSRINDVVGLLSEISVRPIYKGMPHYLESLREYESRGFTLHSLHVVARSPADGVVEYDCLMVRDRLSA